MEQLGEDLIVFCDNHLLVVNKPAGVLTQSDRTGDPDLLSLAKDYVAKRFDKAGEAFLGLVHRIDRPVSGLIVFARTSKAASRLATQFRDRTVTKRYLALVEGHLAGGSREETHVRKYRKGIVQADKLDDRAQLAAIEWQALGAQGGNTLVEVGLITGRKHQIRFQLSRIGHPIVGDFRYGATSGFEGRNIALHCYRLGVNHPTKKSRMEWTAAPPSSWGHVSLPPGFLDSADRSFT